MKNTHRLSLCAALSLLTASITLAQQTEKSVALKTSDQKYVTAATGSVLDLSGSKIASKQTFTLVDMNGGDLADGDEVQVRYTPTPKPGEPPKSNFWVDKKGELKRGSEAGVFKVKKTDATYSFQAASGKFVGAPASGTGPLALVDGEEGALKVEIVETPAVGGAPAASASPAAAASPAEKPAE